MKFLAIVLLSSSLLACKANNSKTENGKQELEASVSSHTGHNHTAEHSTNKTPESTSLAKLKFKDSDVYNFGEVKEESIVEHTFKFKNEGTEALSILDVKTSCGCTVPEYSKTPVAPGKEGELTVRFNTRGKRGTQNKIVRIITNTSEKEIKVYIKGQVKPKADLSNGPVKQN